MEITTFLNSSYNFILITLILGECFWHLVLYIVLHSFAPMCSRVMSHCNGAAIDSCLHTFLWCILAPLFSELMTEKYYCMLSQKFEMILFPLFIYWKIKILSRMLSGIYEYKGN